MKLLPAPWTGEPDELDFTDKATGYPIAMRRNRVYAWCGYVGVPPSHAWHGKQLSHRLPAPEGFRTTACDIDALGVLTVFFTAFALEEGQVCLVSLVPCHRGMSYAGPPHWGEDGRASWWFGFDCAHAGDVRPRDLFSEPLMAFAAELLRDAPAAVQEALGRLRGEKYRNVAYVRETCLRMAQELKFYEMMKV